MKTFKLNFKNGKKSKKVQGDYFKFLPYGVVEIHIQNEYTKYILFMRHNYYESRLIGVYTGVESIEEVNHG